jgi:RHS repeat-associated protein
VQSHRHFIGAGGMAFAVLVTTGALPALTAAQTAPTALVSVAAVKIEYWHKDQLGSLIATTDHAGAVTGRYAYDPFGKRRYTTGTYDAFGTLVVDWTTDTNNGNDRGFTGHEHLDDLGLVHMNGRIFDPHIGRFLQADPLIQSLEDLQNYDRYGYCIPVPRPALTPAGTSSSGWPRSGGRSGARKSGGPWSRSRSVTSRAAWRVR